MESRIKELEKKCAHYEKLLGVGDYDPVKSAFIVLVKMLNQQTSFLNGFDIKTHIAQNDKESPTYKRAMDMMDGLSKMIAAVNELRSTLRLSKEDIQQIEGNKTIFQSKITTPESIADNIGEIAGGKSQ